MILFDFGARPPYLNVEGVLFDRLIHAGDTDRHLDITLVALDSLLTRHLLGEAEVQAWTYCLDNAIRLLALVCPDHDWIVGQTNGGETIYAQVGPLDPVFAATPALALCAAIVRAVAIARRDEEEEKGDGPRVPRPVDRRLS